MAEFPNNQFTRDSIAEHIVRVRMCVTGMTEHPEVAFRGDLVVKMTAHRDDFEGLENQHAEEWGDEQAATAYTNLCEDALSLKLSSARYMIESMIEEEEIAPVTANELRRDFGIEASKPRSRKGILELALQEIETNARYVDEGSPYALPEDFFEDMETKATALEAAMSAHERELGERLTIGDAKLAERDRGDVLLSNAFKWLVALYGEDANILLEFGMVPKSQIHTPGQPEPGEPEPPENWNDAPTGFTVTKSPLGDSIDINCGVHPEADGINVYLSEGEYGDDTVADRQSTPEWAGAPMPLQVDVAYNVRHWLWVCAVKDGVEGAFAGPLWIEFTEPGPTPIVPV